MASSVGGGQPGQSHRFEAKACLWGRECLKIGGQDGAEVTLVGRLRFAKPLQTLASEGGIEPMLPKKPLLWAMRIEHGLLGQREPVNSTGPSHLL